MGYFRASSALLFPSTFEPSVPELAEVAYFAARWAPGLGQKIQRVHTGPKPRPFRQTPAGAFAALAGTTYLGGRTHGKNMLFEFSRGLWLTGHLGMTGELLTLEPTHVPTGHDHLVLFTKTTALIFRDFRMFGALRLDESRAPPAAWQALPPEIQSPEFTIARVAGALQRHARSPLKAFLLDQAWFPGIGNWMADEACFQLRLHPSTPSGAVDPASLRNILRTICQKSMKTIATDWSDPPASWLMTHRWKAGGICPDKTCRTPLVRDTLRGRTACWCPRCQPG
jgi:formamidopyrimidine-DNA glycosylase